MRTLIITLLFSALSLSISAQNKSGSFWIFDFDKNEIDESLLQVVPNSYRAVQLNHKALGVYLRTSPPEFSDDYKANPLLVSIPLPNGETWTFKVAKTKTMADALAAKFPNINSYAGQGIEDPTATIKLEHSPIGFHAMIRSSQKGTIFIEPFNLEDHEHYILYFKKDYANPFSGEVVCQFNNFENGLSRNEVPEVISFRSESELKIYSLAIACTAEYVAKVGGTLNSAMSELNTIVNRINGVFENEVAVRMELVADNDQLIYLNPNTDPYNNNGPNVLSENQTNIDNVIGSDNYDIGHLLSTCYCEDASFSSACDIDTKARGVVGTPDPTGASFHIDFIAHNIAHQLGARHTFNGNSGECQNTYFYDAGSAYEPGSGSTILAFPGYCPGQNIAIENDDYFHVGNMEQMINFTRNGNGNTCGELKSSNNVVPLATVDGNDWHLPINTPFKLIGAGSDTDGDILTYNWEQYDLGPSGHPNFPVGNAPIWRSWPPTQNNYRYFPRLSSIIANTTVLGETYADYSRDMTFRFTVRDNSAGSGGVSWTQITTEVHEEAGPFLVINPNSGAEEWEELSMQTISWDVANTDQTPISCNTVNIKLSIDGGYNYTTTLATAVPNTGSAVVEIPAGALTDDARIMVECATNIFFDISNADFSIIPTTVSVRDLSTAGINIFPNPAKNKLNLSILSQDQQPLQIHLVTALGQLIYTHTKMIGKGKYFHSIDIASLASGIYFIQFQLGEKSSHQRILVE